MPSELVLINLTKVTKSDGEFNRSLCCIKNIEGDSGDASVLTPSRRIVEEYTIYIKPLVFLSKHKI